MLNGISFGSCVRLAALALAACTISLLPRAADAGGEGVLAADQSVHDERFYRFVADGSRFEILAQGFGWAEGPVWVPALDALLFSDIAGDTVYRWRESEGVSEYLKPSGHPPDDGGHAWRGANGLAVDARGRLLLAQQGRRVMTRMRAGLSAPAPEFEVLAERFRDARLNSPNDLTLTADGGVIFTDPPYGLAGFENSPDKELAFSGIFHLAPSGELRLLDDSLEKPNGVALSIDQRRLYVSNSEPGRAAIHVYALDAQKRTADGRLFFDAAALEAGAEGSTDGMAMHRSGSLFVSLPGGVGILAPEGELLGRVLLGQVTNLAFGPDYRYLYVTQPDRLLRLPVSSGRALP